MATARKKTPASKPAKKAPAAKAKAPAPKAKPAAAKKPAGKPVKASAVKPAAKPAPKLAAKGAAHAASKPASKPAPKAAVKPAPKVVGKPAVKGTPPKAAPKVIGKPAVKGTPGKVVPPPPPVKVAPKAPPRLVPATADAKAAHLALSKPAKATTGKAKLTAKAPPEVRPLGVLPPESMARPRTNPVPQRAQAAPARPQPGNKPAAPSKKGDERLTDADLKHFEQRLLQERAKIMKEMGHLESTLLKVNPRDSAGDLSGYTFHMADAGTDSMEREKAFDIASKEGRLLMEIDDALRRLYSGSYGICEASGKPIARARLEALPWARLSIEEQAKWEKEQRAGRAAAPGTE
jgi:RNA polymerase-binding transcription factor DksA